MNDLPEKKDYPLKPSEAEEKFRELLALIARLRSPGGCPWDQSRRQEDIARYLLEESYEVVEAIEGGSPPALMEELGDLLFQILFLARMAEEAKEFDIADVLKAITEKMIRRHPHVFGNTKVKNVEEVRNNWERIKKEVEHKGAGDARLFNDIPRSLPTLAKTQQITARASSVGFDWENTVEVLKKVEEELGEFRAALEKGDQEAMHDEAGDLLLTLVNLCRFVKVDAEAALRSSLGKLTRRFAHIEQALALQGKTPADSSLAEMDRLWNEAKEVTAVKAVTSFANLAPEDGSEPT
ncbi:MAG: nucleoside triphosphate pyrophosphohydrolase [Syntrophales bacterium]